MYISEWSEQSKMMQNQDTPCYRSSQCLSALKMAMYHVVAVLAMLAPVQSFNMEVAMTSSLTFDAEAAKNRPVSKVLLKKYYYSAALIILGINSSYSGIWGKFN